MKTRLLIIVCLIFLLPKVRAQNEDIPRDPLQDFKRFAEVFLTVDASRINTNYSYFQTNSGSYQFIKGRYLPNFDAGANFGWRLTGPSSERTLYFKTGLNTLTRSADLTDANGTQLQFNEYDFQIPVLIGERIPMQHNTIKNNLYRAVEFYVGFYASSSLAETLSASNNLDTQQNNTFGDVIRLGYAAEIAFSALNAKGHGNRFGLKFFSDMTNLIKIKETKSQLYPYYNTAGVFYNFANKYR